jgi:hypothetical protein
MMPHPNHSSAPTPMQLEATNVWSAHADVLHTMQSVHTYALRCARHCSMLVLNTLPHSVPMILRVQADCSVGTLQHHLLSVVTWPKQPLEGTSNAVVVAVLISHVQVCCNMVIMGCSCLRRHDFVTIISQCCYQGRYQVWVLKQRKTHPRGASQGCSATQTSFIFSDF